MNAERYERLKRLFENKIYFVRLKELAIYTTINKRGEPVTKLNPIIKISKQGIRKYVRVTENKKQYEYDMHEIISVWCGIFVIDKNCFFKDGDRTNCHPSNLYWHFRDENPNTKGKGKISYKQAIEIRKAICPMHKTGFSHLQALADKYELSKSYVAYLRTKKCKNHRKQIFKQV